MTDDPATRDNNEEFGERLNRLRLADTLAEQEFFELFGPRIERVCAKVLGNLPNQPGAIVSPESKALSAMRSVMMGLRSGRFDSLEDESGLLRLLITIASRKCHDAQRAHFAKVRGGGRIVRPSDYPDDESRNHALERFGQFLETPEFAVEMQERCERLMSMLSDKDQVIAQKRLEGYTEEEIGNLIGMSRRAVQLHIKDIREAWRSTYSEVTSS